MATTQPIHKIHHLTLESSHFKQSFTNCPFLYTLTFGPCTWFVLSLKISMKEINHTFLIHSHHFPTNLHLWQTHDANVSLACLYVNTANVVNITLCLLLFCVFEAASSLQISVSLFQKLLETATQSNMYCTLYIICARVEFDKSHKISKYLNEYITELLALYSAS